MPKTPKTALKQAALPLAVHASGDPWQPSGDEVATVPVPNDVIITRLKGLIRNATANYGLFWSLPSGMIC